MADHTIARTSYGPVQGGVGDGILFFKGIPYAAAPTGAGRFKPPAPPAPWQEVRDATMFGARAIQPERAFTIAPEVIAVFASDIAEPMSEDCLFLNIWTPDNQNEEEKGDLPVMVWLHGGAFISGSGAAPWYDGSKLARKGNVVVVTLNHRLGALGHLYLGELAGAEFAQSGNVGMLDIVAALRWVRDNIAAFGGDPGNVTIFGESGGGAKACVLMAMPAAEGLFHKAIVESGPAVEMMAKDAATQTARQMMTELGLTDAAQLEGVPAARLLEAQGKVLAQLSALSFANRRRQGFNPVIDGTVLPGGPFEPAAPSISAHIPMMIGTNKDEMNLFHGVDSWPDQVSDENLVEAVGKFVGERATAIVAAYRYVRPKASAREIALAIATDQSVRMPSLTIADRQMAQNGAPVFVYLFTWETPVLAGRLGSCHALEIPFVFDNLDKTKLTGDAPTRLVLADTM
ncbi:MAG: carboxylesterase/lipase family protein, partial [Stellaceae bacterium]